MLRSNSGVLRSNSCGSSWQLHKQVSSSEWKWGLSTCKAIGAAWRSAVLTGAGTAPAAKLLSYCTSTTGLLVAGIFSYVRGTACSCAVSFLCHILVHGALAKAAGGG